MHYPLLESQQAGEGEQYRWFITNEKGEQLPLPDLTSSDPFAAASELRNGSVAWQNTSPHKEPVRCRSRHLFSASAGRFARIAMVAAQSSKRHPLRAPVRRRSRGRRRRPSHMPEGLLLDAPEQCRDRYERGEQFAFGATLIDFDPATALRRLHDRRRSRQGRPRRPAKARRARRQFRPRRRSRPRRETIAGPRRALHSARPGHRRPGARAAQLDGRPAADPPLPQPAAARTARLRGQSGHRYADAAGCTPASSFVPSRNGSRPSACAAATRATTATHFDDAAITLLENRLTWLDLEYGRRDERKSLGGARADHRRRSRPDRPRRPDLGAVRPRREKPALRLWSLSHRRAWSRPDRVPASQAAAGPLPPTAAIARAAAEHDLDPEAFRHAAEQLRVGTYKPDRPHRMVLRSADGEPRKLHIPSVKDRALQRLLLARLGPALDRLFETSSFAWRRGLNRESAARRIERLVRDGWHFAVAPTSTAFSIGSRGNSCGTGWKPGWETTPRLRPSGRSSRPRPGNTGIPTGSPLSPLLGNLLLDRFDESIEREGGRLVRYADDFLILTRRREDAERLHARARAGRRLPASAQRRLGGD